MEKKVNTQVNSKNPQLKRKRSPMDSASLEEPPEKRTTLQNSSTKSKKSVRFLIFSDTHDTEDNDEDHGSAFQPPTISTPIDVVLHCGDLTSHGTLASLSKAITKLAAIPAELRLIIAGNHDITLDEPYYLSQGGTAATPAAATKIVKDAAAAQGVTYLDEGMHAFTLINGAAFTVYASPYTPRFGESAFQYPTGEDRFNPAATTPAWATNTATPTSIVPEGVDVIMTHGPPKYVLDDTGSNSGGCEHLRRAVCRVRPRLHCFGHVHRGYGAQRVIFEEPGEGEDKDGMVCLPKEFVGKNQARRKGYAKLSPGSEEAFKENGQTLMVNAAIMNDEGEATNAPWLVELEF